MTSSNAVPDDGLTKSALLETVKRKAGLEDLYDARDIAEVVFRTLRDLMTTEAADRVAAELEGKLLTTGDSTKDRLVEVWKDTNWIVRLLSRIRPPLEIDTDTFLFRISQEAGLSRGVTPEDATEAVFSALKRELSDECQQEIASFLPEPLREAWRAV
ncbi:MAG: DUF2267 domain-containing protein [Elainellaceae cyanobacterium]